MGNLEIGTWLLQQAPVIVVMGIVIWWLAKRLEKAQDEKDVLSKDVVKLTTIWEEKANDGKDEEILRLLTEIKTIVSAK
ncbi:MAG: hypothetical protein DI539_25370 [Flavobacterium psychrophilum]|nr:MAG: hypothetical protein DI539_25370 [Flavobacterium psychrophilum]